jgi:predicted  nucleic acid-binding Zn-ribbon protein
MALDPGTATGLLDSAFKAVVSGGLIVFLFKNLKQKKDKLEEGAIKTIVDSITGLGASTKEQFKDLAASTKASIEKLENKIEAESGKTECRVKEINFQVQENEKAIVSLNERVPPAKFSRVQPIRDNGGAKPRR